MYFGILPIIIVRILVCTDGEVIIFIIGIELCLNKEERTLRFLQFGSLWLSIPPSLPLRRIYTAPATAPHLLLNSVVHSHWSRNVEACLSLVESVAGASSLMP